MDLFGQLAEDHRKVEQHFGKVERAESAAGKQRAFRELEEELQAHMQAEEEVFYSVLRDEAGASNLIRDAISEHREMREHISSLRSRHPSGEAWERHLRMLRNLFDQHVRKEEEQLFARASGSLELGRRETILESLVSRKREIRHGDGGPETEDHGIWEAAGGAAKESAGRMARWAADQAQRTAEKARERGQAIAGEQQQKAAAYARDIAEALRETSENLGRRGRQTLAHYTSTAAEGIEDLCNDLEESDIRESFRRAGDFAQRHPFALIGCAVFAGFMLARFLKGGEAGEESAPFEGHEPYEQQSEGIRHFGAYHGSGIEQSPSGQSEIEQ